MNLSQAVAVIAYSIRNEKSEPSALARPQAVPVQEVERLINQALMAFTVAGLLKGWDAAHSKQRIRKAFFHWNLSHVDIAMLHGIFRWVIKKA
jgi:tRNA C32,U32 (ribose-2'-O)-methylase TrmJ